MHRRPVIIITAKYENKIRTTLQHGWFVNPCNVSTIVHRRPVIIITVFFFWCSLSSWWRPCLLCSSNQRKKSITSWDSWHDGVYVSLKWLCCVGLWTSTQNHTVILASEVGAHQHRVSGTCCLFYRLMCLSTLFISVSLMAHRLCVNSIPSWLFGWWLRTWLCCVLLVLFIILWNVGASRLGQEWVPILSSQVSFFGRYTEMCCSSASSATRTSQHHCCSKLSNLPPRGERR